MNKKKGGKRERGKDGSRKEDVARKQVIPQVVPYGQN
jgi:hypothetical protein